MTIRIWALSAAVASIVLSASPVAAAQDADLYAAAKKAGETEVTWYQSQIRTEAAEKIGEAFTARYPGIKVNVFNSTAAVAFQRLTQDLKAGAPQADVFGTTDISHMPALKSQGALEKFVPETVVGMVPSVKALNDPDGFYTITYASLTALTYNRDKVKPENVPKHWTDLIDPKWMNQVTIGSPNYSGTLGGWSVMINRLYGMNFFDKLAANKPLVGRSIDDALIHLNSGESSIAAGDVASTSRSIARGNPLGISYPEDGALLLVGPTALIKGSHHPNAGKLFTNYLLTPDAAKVIVGESEQAVIIDAPPPASGVPLKDIKTITVSLDEIIRELPGIKAKWRDLFNG